MALENTAVSNAAPTVVDATGPHALAAGVERIPVTVYTSSAPASRAVAREIAELIRDKAARGETAVLGLATGSTPTAVYDELIRLHREEGLSFKNVVTFNLDEYYPMKPDELQSYNRFMREHLFDHIDIPAGNWHVPDGTIAREAVTKYCLDYERKIREAGGLDFQILGIGRTGHIGFNEPGSPRDSRTRLITLDRVTRMDAASDFFGEWNVPRKAITMGVDTILSAKTVVLLAFGEHKAPTIRRSVEGDVSAVVAASYLQQHPSARIVLDTAAASELTRFKTPWLLGSMSEFGLEWDDHTTRRAAIWLSQTLKKPLLKLTDEDYNEHGLQELLSHRGGAYDINVEVFRALQKTITGWPGGKPAEDREDGGPTFDHANPEVFPKRVVVFSPHPDDDVISMGGTFIRLCEQGHEVHVAYQTSGNIAVWDDKQLTRRAVIWLSTTIRKPILKLTDEDYKEAGLVDLLVHAGNAYQLNIQVFNSIQNTITGWPGGKPNSDDTNRPERALPARKRSIIFSPHPDDDVISMGGTLLRLVDQGHDVHVAYQTSGNIAVFDDDARRFADFVLDFSKKYGFCGDQATSLHQDVVDFFRRKKLGEEDISVVQDIKGLIRKGEASAACRFCGVKEPNVHFLNMPFYETGQVKKKPLSEADIQVVADLLQEVQPHQIFAAGDLRDPHGTHKVCLDAIFGALEHLKGEAWLKDCYVWLYRGAWQEWDVEDIEMAVPISPEELMRKRQAIFKHQSQKDSPVFPGNDKREFWQRAEDRNRTTAALYDQLGLTEYEAIEAFVRHRF